VNVVYKLLLALVPKQRETCIRCWKRHDSHESQS